MATISSLPTFGQSYEPFRARMDTLRGSYHGLFYEDATDNPTLRRLQLESELVIDYIEATITFPPRDTADTFQGYYPSVGWFIEVLTVLPGARATDVLEGFYNRLLDDVLDREATNVDLPAELVNLHAFAVQSLAMRPDPSAEVSERIAHHYYRVASFAVGAAMAPFLNRHVIYPIPLADPRSTTTAVYLRSSKLSVSIADSVIVSGLAHSLSGSPISGDSLHGIMVPSISDTTEILAIADSSTGVILSGVYSGSRDVVVDDSLFNIEELIFAYLKQPALITTTDTLVIEDIGTIPVPAVFHAVNGVEVGAGTNGVGVLVVDDHLVLKSGASWTGIVVIRASESDTVHVTLEDGASIVGVLLVLTPFGKAAAVNLEAHSSIVFSPEAIAIGSGLQIYD